MIACQYASLCSFPQVRVTFGLPDALNTPAAASPAAETDTPDVCLHVAGGGVLDGLLQLVGDSSLAAITRQVCRRKATDLYETFAPVM